MLICLMIKEPLASVVQAKERIRLLLCVETGALSLLGVLTSFAARSTTAQQMMWGIAGNVISLVCECLLGSAPH